MASGYRRLSAADEDEIWLMLRAGHAAKPTARALGWSTSGVRGYLERCGGVRPAQRRRSLGRLGWPSGGRSREGLQGVARCVRKRRGWGVARWRSDGGGAPNSGAAGGG